MVKQDAFEFTLSLCYHWSAILLSIAEASTNNLCLWWICISEVWLGFLYHHQLSYYWDGNNNIHLLWELLQRENWTQLGSVMQLILLLGFLKYVIQDYHGNFIHSLLYIYYSIQVCPYTQSYISAAKDLPQPHVCVALGFLKEKPPPIRASL